MGIFSSPIIFTKVMSNHVKSLFFSSLPSSLGLGRISRDNAKICGDIRYQISAIFLELPSFALFYFSYKVQSIIFVIAYALLKSPGLGPIFAFQTHKKRL
jgi:hypothetical protein